MELFSLFSKKVDLTQLLKDAPITYKLNDKRDAIQLFGQSFYRNDPAENLLNIKHTSVILYGHNGKNLYGIFGNGSLKTDTWNAWTDKQFDNKDISSIHISPFYKAHIVLRLPEDNAKTFIGNEYEPIDEHTILIKYNGSMQKKHTIPHGSTIISIEALQTSEKEYFGPIVIEPTVKCKRETDNAILKTLIIIVAILVLGYLLYRCFSRKEIIVISHQRDDNEPTSQQNV